MKNNIIPVGSVIGIIGGGQLGRMTALAAANLGYKVHIYTPEENSPASHVAYKTTVAPYEDEVAIKEFAKQVDVVSFEFENIPHDSVEVLEEIIPVRPRWQVLHIAQNRIREKNFFKEIGVPTNRFYEVNSLEDLKKGVEFLGGDKALMKTVELGYDGKGQALIKNGENLEEAWESIGKNAAILEEWIPFEKEISVVVAKSNDFDALCYPPAENVHKKGILHTSVVPANISDETRAASIDIAHEIAEKLGLRGLVAVEFFVKQDGGLLVNEIAPRPHNSGHWTMDGCVTSQFEQFVRAICGLPLGAVDILAPIKMLNLIGDDVNGWEEIVKNPNAKLHLYGKREAREGRKMGHVNYITYVSC